jgi:Na+/H+ antiporter NhaD/arsenite permease-like protein
VIVAVLALAAFILRPSARTSLFVLIGAAGLELALGASATEPLSVVLPLVAYIAAALTLAGLIERSGLAERGATALASLARGHTLALYALVCCACALLTSVVSLDGAVVLMVPVLLVLTRRWSVPFAPLFVGVVAVANVSSLALPQGNPTNLVIMERLGLSAQGFAAHMLVPGVAATLVAAVVVAHGERRTLAVPYAPPSREARPLSRAERRAGVALLSAASAAWVAPVIGLAPWWPFTAAVALAAGASRQRPELRIAARVGAQVGALLVLLQVVSGAVTSNPAPGLAGLLVIAIVVGAAAALTNNLPVSVSAAGLLTVPSAYAVAIGLAAGSLALPRGSVATLVAVDAAGPDAPTLEPRRLVPLALGAVITATVLLWLSL